METVTHAEIKKERRTAPWRPLTYYRLSWGAIFAGIAMAMVTQFTLGALGLAIGAGTIDPLSERDPMTGVGAGASLWLLASTIVSVFIGGWLAGLLSGVPRRAEGALHGLLTWGLGTLAALYLLTTAVSPVVGGAAGLLAQRLPPAGRGALTAAPRMADAPGARPRSGEDWADIRQEARGLLGQPGNAQDAEKPGAPGNLQAADTQFEARLERFVNAPQGAAELEDREALIDALTDRTGMTRAEAARTVDQWRTSFRPEQTRARTEQQARQAADAVAEGISKTALLTFAMLVLGACAAAYGGSLAARKNSRRVDAMPSVY